MMARIVNTDNFGGDYPDEKFVENLPLMTREHAQKVCDAINKPFSDLHRRYWKVVPDDYRLLPGFEP